MHNRTNASLSEPSMQRLRNITPAAPGVTPATPAEGPGIADRRGEEQGQGEQPATSGSIDRKGTEQGQQATITASNNCTAENLPYYGYGFTHPPESRVDEKATFHNLTVHKGVGSCHATIEIRIAAIPPVRPSESIEEIDLYFPNRKPNGPKERCEYTKKKATGTVFGPDTSEQSEGTICYGAYADNSFDYRTDQGWIMFGVACVPEETTASVKEVSSTEELLTWKKTTRNVAANPKGCTINELEESGEPIMGTKTTTTRACTRDLTTKAPPSKYLTCCTITKITETPYASPQTETRKECS